jgi:hypothetical protein
VEQSVGHAVIDHVFPLTGRGMVLVVREGFAGSIPRNGLVGVGDKRWKYSGPEFNDFMREGRSQLAVIIREAEAEAILNPGVSVRFWDEPRNSPSLVSHSPAAFGLAHHEVSLGLKLRRSIRVFLLHAAGGFVMGALGCAAVIAITYFSRAGIQWTSAIGILVAGFAPMTVLGAIFAVRDFAKLTLDEITGRPPEHLRHRVRTSRFE